MSQQKKLGRKIMQSGLWILFAMFVICCVDLVGLSARGEMLVPLSGYLTGIFSGVALQFVGAAVSNMKIAEPDPPGKPAKP